MFLIGTEEEDQKDLLGQHIICEYPKIAVLPEDSDEEKIFENRVYTQQLQVFEIAINRWRRYRAAEQLAASAIMSRNMSHNIGSHVLAKVVARDDEDLDKLDVLKKQLSDQDEKEKLDELKSDFKDPDKQHRLTILKKATLNRSKNLSVTYRGAWIILRLWRRIMSRVQAVQCRLVFGILSMNLRTKNYYVNILRERVLNLNLQLKVGDSHKRTE